MNSVSKRSGSTTSAGHLAAAARTISKALFAAALPLALLPASQRPDAKRAAGPQPKIYIATDLEGVAGVYSWQQTRETQAANPEYREARELLMAEIRAVIEGCLAAGAGEIVVRDAHHGARNAIPSLMAEKATYICGTVPGADALVGLDRSVNGVILLGYHAMAGTEDGVLNHTKSSASGRRYLLEDREIGEIAMDALSAGHYGAPVIMVTGDEAVCRETESFLGSGVATVCTKKGYATECAQLIPPARVLPFLARTAEKAVRNLKAARIYRMQVPVRGRLLFPSKELADSYRIKSSETRRIDDTKFERTFRDLRNVAEF